MLMFFVCIGIGYCVIRTGTAMLLQPGAFAILAVFMLLLYATDAPPIRDFILATASMIQIFLIMSIISFALMGLGDIAVFIFVVWLIFAFCLLMVMGTNPDDLDGTAEPVVASTGASHWGSLLLLAVILALTFVVVAYCKRRFYNPWRSRRQVRLVAADYDHRLAAYHRALTYDPAAARTCPPPPKPIGL